METIEFISAAVIALYALIASVLISSAITAPHNTSIVLDHYWKWIRQLLSTAIALLAVAIIRILYQDSTTTYTVKSLIILAIAHIVLLAIFWLSSNICDIILNEKDQPDQNDDIK